MAADPAFESALEALLDGRRLADVSSATGDSPDALEPLRVMEAIARAHRVTLFGEDAGDIEDTTRPLTRWGHLEVGEEIGRGATGTVYRAWDTRLSREVALKLLARHHGNTSDDALAEGRLLARLRHPHIVTVYGADTHEGVAGIWMEFVRGDTLDEVLARDGLFGVEEALLVGGMRLDEWLAEHGPLSPQAALVVALCVCSTASSLTDGRLARALSSLHAAGLVRRADDGWSWRPADGPEPGRRVTDLEVVQRLGGLLFECLTAQPLAHRFTSAGAVLTRLHTLRPGLPPAVADLTARAAAPS